MTGTSSSPSWRRRQQPAVAGDDLAVVRHHHRRRPAVLDQRGGDLGDLIVRVRPRVARVRLQARDRPLLDLLGQEWEHRRCIRKGEAKGWLFWSAGAAGCRPGLRLDSRWTPGWLPGLQGGFLDSVLAGLRSPPGSHPGVQAKPLQYPVFMAVGGFWPRGGFPKFAAVAGKVSGWPPSLTTLAGRDPYILRCHAKPCGSRDGGLCWPSS